MAYKEKIKQTLSVKGKKSVRKSSSIKNRRDYYDYQEL
jgi:hypothetical protein